MKQIGVAIVGTGWCGGIQAETLAGHPLVKELHLAEVRPERLQELAARTRATSATTEYRQLLDRQGMQLPMSTMPGEPVALPLQWPKKIRSVSGSPS